MLPFLKILKFEILRFIRPTDVNDIPKLQPHNVKILSVPY